MIFMFSCCHVSCFMRNCDEVIHHHVAARIVISIYVVEAQLFNKVVLFYSSVPRSQPFLFFILFLRNILFCFHMCFVIYLTASVPSKGIRGKVTASSPCHHKNSQPSRSEVQGEERDRLLGTYSTPNAG